MDGINSYYNKTRKELKCHCRKWKMYRDIGKHVPGNYRSVSLTSYIGTFVESLIMDVNNHQKQNN